jgi:hypothetical protein
MTIQPWPGALWRAENGNQYRVNRVREDGWLYLVSHDWGNSVDWYNPIGGGVDLTDPDTFRGAVARLAARLGLTREVLLLHLPTVGVWVLFNGDVRYSACFDHPASDPAEALGAWWASMEKL